jgi:hypothetical protein
MNRVVIRHLGKEGPLTRGGAGENCEIMSGVFSRDLLDLYGWNLVTRHWSRPCPPRTQYLWRWLNTLVPGVSLVLWISFSVRHATLIKHMGE